MVLLSNGLRLLHTELIGEGSASFTEFSPRKIGELAVRMNAPIVALAHNHPDGRAIPSQQDIDTTLKLQYILDQLKITLLDHFIVSGDQCTPIIHDGYIKQ